MTTCWLPVQVSVDSGETVSDPVTEPLRTGNSPDTSTLFVSCFGTPLYARGPAKQTARAHVATLVEAAERTAVQESAPPAGRGPSSKRRLALPKRRLALLTAALVLGVLLLLAGLAAAGVKLPGAARAPFDGFGIQLPNQARADPVKGVIH